MLTQLVLYAIIQGVKFLTAFAVFEFGSNYVILCLCLDLLSEYGRMGNFLLAEIVLYRGTFLLVRGITIIEVCLILFAAFFLYLKLLKQPLRLIFYPRTSGLLDLAKSQEVSRITGRKNIDEIEIRHVKLVKLLNLDISRIFAGLFFNHFVSLHLGRYLIFHLFSSILNL